MANVLSQVRWALSEWWRVFWNYYVKWPSPLWRIRGYARITIAGRQFRFHLSGTYHIAVLFEFLAGRWEPAVLSFAEKTIQSGDVFLDIGASTGPFTLLASERAGLEGRVYAFEPDPVACRLLERNVSDNGLANVTVVPRGVTGTNGNAWLEAPRLGIGLTQLTSEGSGEEVQTVTLDHFLAEHDVEPSVIKIDVEGGEVGVLAGGRHGLRRARVILLEFHEHLMRASGASPEEFYRALFELEKRVILLDGSTESGAEPGADLRRDEVLKGNVRLALVSTDVPL